MAMIEETGQVVAIEAGDIWVQIQPRSACSQCHIGSNCGSSVLARWFGQRVNRIRVRNHLDLRIGQDAVIGIHESALLKASLLAYLMPMLAMLAAAMLAGALGAGDAGVALWSVAGLGFGLMLLRRLGRVHKRSVFQAVLLRPASAANHSLNIVIQRGTLS